MPQLDMPVIMIALTFIVAGGVKGLTGMGLPTITVGLLGLAMAPSQAVALLIVPSLVTNVWQFLLGPNPRLLVRRTWTMLIGICAATWIGSFVLLHHKAEHVTAALGSVLIIYAIVGFAKIRIAVTRRAERWLSPLIGAATGLISGATGVFVIPAVPYLQALGLEKEDLVQALGLSFTVSTVALAATLASHGVFHVAAGAASLLCTAPALGGMFVGQWLRARINQIAFRRMFFAGLFALGADLIARALL